MSEVRSSELETRLSSSGYPVEREEDTAASGLREVMAFHALEGACGLDAETLSKFRDRFQFPQRVRVHLPQKEERACHFLPREVCFYEAIFQCGFRFLVHPFIMELLSHFNITLGQLMPNSWRIVISCMEIWLAVTEGDMIKVDEFTYLYRLKDSREYRYYELVPQVKKARVVTNLPSSFRYWIFRFFFLSGDDWETPSNEICEDVTRLLCHWRAPSLGALSFYQSSFLLCSFPFLFIYYYFFKSLLTFLSCVRIVKKCPKLKSKYKSHVKVAIEYANTIDDFNNLLGLRTLAHHCFSPEPFAYVLRAIEIKEKSRCSFSFIAILNSLHSFFFF